MTTTPILSLAQLEHLLALTKKKLALSLDLEKIEKEIASVFAGEKPGPVARTPARRGRPTKAAAAKSPRKIKRGTLKPRILTALSSAGPDGLSAAEVAENIGAKKNAVAVWLYTAGKKVKGLKKVGRGRFALKG